MNIMMLVYLSDTIISTFIFYLVLVPVFSMPMSHVTCQCQCLLDFDEPAASGQRPAAETQTNPRQVNRRPHGVHEVKAQRTPEQLLMTKPHRKITGRRGHWETTTLAILASLCLGQDHSV